MTEQTATYTTSTTHARFGHTASAIIAATEREYWERKHRELVRLDNALCEIFSFSRAGMVKGKQVLIKDLQRIIKGERDEQ